MRAVHFVIMGCGRVGVSLATDLDEAGHSVSVVDQEPRSFRKLKADFSGSTVTGVGFDRDTLRQAGIERADAFAAVSSGDNSNIISARVARETFGVDNVVARIYDPRRADIYQRLGIPTVATVRWSADQILHQLIPGGVHEDYRDPSGQVVLAELHSDPSWVGQPIRRLEQETGARVAFLTRLGEGVLPHSQSVVQDGDVIHVLSMQADLERVATGFARGPEGS